MHKSHKLKHVEIASRALQTSLSTASMKTNLLMMTLKQNTVLDNSDQDNNRIGNSNCQPFKEPKHNNQLAAVGDHMELYLAEDYMYYPGVVHENC